MYMYIFRPGFLLVCLWLGWLGLAAQAPVADFTAPQTTRCEPFPLVANFQNLSTGAGNSYQWFFGDAGNSTSTFENPFFTYSDPGCYDVTLVATNAQGSDTLTQSCFIEILPQPEPLVSVDVPVGCVPFTTTVSDSSIANAPSITNWTYIFSDGTNSNVQNPTLTFLTPDTLDLVLTVRNSFGCEATASFPGVLVGQQPPAIDFAVDTNSACEPPLLVTYLNNTQLNGAQDPVFTWQFPGGVLPIGSSTYVGPNPPPVAYSNDGSYNASLTLSTSNQCDTSLSFNNIVGIGGVDADFTVTNQVICVGQTVTFQATSTGGVTQHQWDLGESVGIDTTGNLITYTYLQPGVYPITLYANNADCGDTLRRDSFITVRPSPTAAWTVSDTFFCQPGLPFNFTDQSIDAVQWDWDFDDGSTSTAQNPSHTYTSFGLFNICLTVTNAQGCTDTFCDTVRVQPPNVDFEATTEREGCIPLQVEFQDLSSNVGDPVVSWAWSFPGAIPPTASNPDPNVLYNQEGEFPVTLIITTASGCTDTLERSNYIRAGLPPVNGFTSDRDSVCVLEGVTFIPDSFNVDWDYYWDFQYMAPGNFALNNDSTPITAYPDTGVYDVALIVDNSGCRDTLVEADFIFVSPPEANFEVSDTLLCQLPATVSFTDESVGPADVIEWFVNGTLFSTAQTPQPYAINSPGVYEFQQVLTNSLTGCTDTFAQVVFAGNPDAAGQPLVTDGCRPLDVPLQNNSQNYSTTTWELRQNGTPIQAISSDAPTFTIDQAGTYSLFMTVRDQFGCVDTFTPPPNITVNGPYLDVSVSPREGCVGQVIQFSDSALLTFPGNAPPNPPVSVEWDFGDPASGASNTSTSLFATHVYSSPGSYDITYISEDQFGCGDTLELPDHVVITRPEATFSIADSSTCLGAAVDFTNTSQGFGLAHTWSFGDGDSSLQANPTHTYPDTGFYAVRLISEDQNGCRDTVVQPQAVYIEPFEVDFVGSPLSGLCPPLSTQFQSTIVGDSTNVSYQWDFGVFNSAGSILPDPGFPYLEAGSFDVQLIATHPDGCRDTMLKEDYVNVGGPLGSYRVEPDEICLGDSICLTATTQLATSLAVDFQDGTVVQFNNLPGGSDTTVTCYTYTAVDTVSPVLIVSDASGCTVFYRNRDTLLIHPRPTANLLPQDTVGCSPLPVSFQDASQPADTSLVAWLWDFGDGDSSTQTNPAHTFIGDTTYTVTLEVEDGYGCRDTATTTAVPQEGAIPAFEAADTTGCAPFLAQFTDLTFNVEPNYWMWIFGDGDTLEGFQNPDHLYFNDGVYTVTLIVGDSLGCRDTLVKPDYIVLDRPNPVVAADPPQACNPVTVTFSSDSSTGPSPFQAYEWLLVNLDTGDTLRNVTTAPTDSLALEFPEAGEYEMILVLTDEQGCVGISDPQPVSIRERTTPAPLALRNVSVQGPSAVELLFERYPGDDFDAYAVYRSRSGGTPQQIALINDQDSLQFVDDDPALDCESTVYCYQVLVRNFCGEFSELARTEAHCTIELAATPATNAIRLEWVPYAGYPVSEYEVYRVADYDPASAVRIAVVPGTNVTYLDEETFCRDSISYRVRAVGAGDPVQRSWSDVAADAPNYQRPTDRNDVITATVVDDTVIDVSWTPYPGYKPANYVLERSADGGTAWQTLDTTGLSTFSFTDPNVLVDEQSYQYRVTTIDSCGDQTVPGLIGQTILLRAEFASGSETPRLTWSPYREWAGGVLTYAVEVFNESTGNWEEVGLTSRNDRTFLDRETQLSQVEICYRIRATEAGGRGAESVSNEDCLIFGPRLYIPNVFTPNNDGDNDVFRIVAPNVRDAEIWIYNRWGRKIYHTDNIDEHWNGLYNGQAVPEGVYVYRLVGIGENGEPLERSGSVTVVR